MRPLPYQPDAVRAKLVCGTDEVCRIMNPLRDTEYRSKVNNWSITLSRDRTIIPKLNLIKTRRSGDAYLDFQSAIQTFRL